MCSVVWVGEGGFIGGWREGGGFAGGYASNMGRGLVGGRSCVDGDVAEGYSHFMEVLGGTGSRGFRLEVLSRGMRGDALTCRGHPYMFLNYTVS